jgi:hypothetical protein
MSSPSEDHWDPMCIAGGDHFVILARAAWLDHSDDTSLGGNLDAVRKRKECV